MGVLYLSVELCFDLIACILGIVLAYCAGDNYPKFYWGIIAFCIGAVFMWENIGWLTIVTDTPEYRFTDLLNIEKMLKWYVLASIVALFPTASLLPGYLTPFRILFFLLPSILFTTVGVCYLGFNGEMTPLLTFSDVFACWRYTDVMLRVILFFFSIITPIFFCFYPLFRRQVYRQINGMMYVFIGIICLFVLIYCLFTLFINEFIFNLFGATSILFAVFFSIQYLLKENPFSSRCMNNKEERTMPERGMPDMFLSLFSQIENHLYATQAYTNSDYNLHILSETLRIKENQLSLAIKFAGFSSFREYINDLRLRHFKRLIESGSNKSIKELIYLSGFNSRSTFYRNFSDKYGISPTKFVDFVFLSYFIISIFEKSI